MYTNFELWKKSIENGMKILGKRMLIGDQYKLIMSVLAEQNLYLEQNRQSNHYMSLAWRETLAGLEMRNKIINQKRYENKNS